MVATGLFSGLLPKAISILLFPLLIIFPINPASDINGKDSVYNAASGVKPVLRLEFSNPFPIDSLAEYVHGEKVSYLEGTVKFKEQTLTYGYNNKDGLENLEFIKQVRSHTLFTLEDLDNTFPDQNLKASPDQIDQALKTLTVKMIKFNKECPNLEKIYKNDRNVKIYKYYEN